MTWMRIKTMKEREKRRARKSQRGRNKKKEKKALLSMWKRQSSVKP